MTLYPLTSSKSPVIGWTHSISECLNITIKLSTLITCWICMGSGIIIDWINPLGKALVAIYCWTLPVYLTLWGKLLSLVVIPNHPSSFITKIPSLSLVELHSQNNPLSSLSPWDSFSHYQTLYFRQISHYLTLRSSQTTCSYPSHWSNTSCSQ